MAEWCRNHPLVKKAYFFGSRFKGLNREDSDFDIGVELNVGPHDSNLLSTWIFEGRDMRDDLQKLLTLKVDLQWYSNEEETPEMHKYLKEASIVIYQ
ncbi:MAG: nucleotidyltransferase domain-containing protein [Oleiphilaceae bacterium]|nr:nucleotidyltransferase domain-containing protein [Oleiphilaceae bacterium]